MTNAFEYLTEDEKSDMHFLLKKVADNRRLASMITPSARQTIMEVVERDLKTTLDIWEAGYDRYIRGDG